MTVHHIVPRKVRQDDSASNLADLCIDCHALVERHYWRAMATNNPQAASLFKEACRVFWRRANRRQKDLAMDAQNAVWPLLLSSVTDWRAVYQDALVWSQTVVPNRRVDPGSAIMSEPWWSQRS